MPLQCIDLARADWKLIILYVSGDRRITKNILGWFRGQGRSHHHIVARILWLILWASSWPGLSSGHCSFHPGFSFTFPTSGSGEFSFVREGPASCQALGLVMGFILYLCDSSCALVLWLAPDLCYIHFSFALSLLWTPNSNIGLSDASFTKTVHPAPSRLSPWRDSRIVGWCDPSLSFPHGLCSVP